MFSTLTSINELFTCFKLPILILRSDFSIVHKYNYNYDLLNIFHSSQLINDIKSTEFKPGIISFKYEDKNFTIINFYHKNRKTAYFLIGPYSLKEDDKYDNNLASIDLNSLMQIANLYNNTLNTKNKKKYSPVIQGVIKYIENNYSEVITMDKICSTFNINKCYLCNTFKKETGMTFINYLNNYKIEKSKELLKDPSLSLLDISLSVGFNNQSYYSTTFKKFTNMTPLEYRAEIL